MGASDKILITAMICLTAVELYALNQGLNGTLLTIFVIVIAGIAGIALPQPKFLKGGGK